MLKRNFRDAVLLTTQSFPNGCDITLILLVDTTILNEPQIAKQRWHHRYINIFVFNLIISRIFRDYPDLFASFLKLLIESLVNDLIWLRIDLCDFTLNFMLLNTFNCLFLGLPSLSILYQNFLPSFHFLWAFVYFRVEGVRLLLLHLVLLNISVDISWWAISQRPQILGRVGYLKRFFVEQRLKVKTLLLILFFYSIPQVVVPALLIVNLVVHELF